MVMGYRLPEYDPRLRAGSAPVASAGTMVNAEALGAGRNRDLMHFGEGVGQLGGAVTRIANIKQERVDRTKKMEEMTSVLKEYDAWEKNILETRKGMDAKDLDVEARKWFEERKKQALGRFDTHRQRDLFTPEFEQLMNSSAARFSRYAFDQVAEAERNARDNANTETARQAAGKFRYDDEALAKGLAGIHANIETNLQGQKPETVNLAKDEATRKYYTAIATGRAADAPESALAFLDRKEVQEAFTPAELKKLRDELQKAKTEADDSAVAKQNNLDAMEDAASTMTENEARGKYFADSRLTEKQAEAKLNTFKATRTADNAVKIADQNNRKEQIENAYAEAGFSIARMPEGLKLTAKEQAELVRWGNAFQANGGKNPPPDVNFLFTLEKMSQAELQEYILNPDNSETFYRGVGGSGSRYASGYIDKALGRKAQEEKRPLTDTNLGWAAAKIAEDEGLVLGSARDADHINDFAKRFTVLAKQQAMADGLKNENDLPPEKRNEIYQRMRVKGTYVGKPTLNTLTFGLLGSEERSYYDMLKDEEADFANFTEHSGAPAPDPGPRLPTAEDDDFWAAGSGIDMSGMERGPKVQPPTASQQPPEPSQAVRDAIGHKGNVTKKPITDAEGVIRFWEIIEASPTGKKIIYYDDTTGRAVSKETALAGRK